MPTVGVVRDDLFKRMGYSYTPDELVKDGKAQTLFEDLCFEFGIELDDVTSEKEMVAKEQNEAKAAALDDTVIYKVDIPANRYDLLCIEGIARSLRIFTELEPAPSYKVVEPKGPRQVMRVHPSTQAIRPYVVCAILRGMTFDEKVYKSFIDLQDKLHQNVCRGRKLVAIGTHDLATVEGPFSFSAPKPEDISFVPLTEEERVFSGKELMDHYKTDPGCKHLAPYVPLIYDSPVYPLIKDAKGTVMSLPPIINGRHSRIQLHTKDVFIECTALDLTKAHIVLDTMVTMFSEYCEVPFTVEPVDVVYEEPVLNPGADKPGSNTTGAGEPAMLSTETTPRLMQRTADATVEEITSVIGVDLEPDDIIKLCGKMQLGPAEYLAEVGPGQPGDNSMRMKTGLPLKRGTVRVTVPPTRSDILHSVDIVEDVAIAYGFNRLLPGTQPPVLTVGQPLPINHFCDQLRDEIARAGYMEMLTHGLCMTRENYDYLGRPNTGHAVELSNPAMEEYEIVRTTLLPGMLKTLSHKKSMPKKNGIKFFEISDVVLKDDADDIGARNERRLAAAYAGLGAGFEVIHGLVDRIMTLNQVVKYNGGDDATKQLRYNIVPCEDPLVCGTFFPGRRASIVMTKPGPPEWVTIGEFGVVHPDVLVSEKYDIDFPCSLLEMNIELLAGGLGSVSMFAAPFRST